MVKSTLSDDEILELLADGWKPRRKYTGNNEYIYLRRGSQKELSLGRMRDELSWLFEKKITTASPAVPETQKAASIAQLQRLKKNLKNFASKTALNRLSKRFDAFERTAKQRILANEIFIYNSEDCETEKQKDTTVKTTFDLYDTALIQLLNYRENTAPLLATIKKQNEELESRIEYLEGLSGLSHISCPSCGQNDYYYMIVCGACSHRDLLQRAGIEA